MKSFRLLYTVIIVLFSFSLLSFTNYSELDLDTKVLKDILSKDNMITSSDHSEEILSNLDDSLFIKTYYAELDSLKQINNISEIAAMDHSITVYVNDKITLEVSNLGGSIHTSKIAVKPVNTDISYEIPIHQLEDLMNKYASNRDICLIELMGMNCSFLAVSEKNNVQYILIKGREDILGLKLGESYDLNALNRIFSKADTFPKEVLSGTVTSSHNKLSVLFVMSLVVVLSVVVIICLRIRRKNKYDKT